jgi:uncharacterized protein
MTALAPAEPTLVAPAQRRLLGPDVTRAVALIGVVVMNYHGYMNGAGARAGPDSSFAQRLFDPFTGVLSTRFATTFMVVAGVGVALMTERSRLTGDRVARSADRWRLVRRGVLLYSFGFVLDWIWPGTILFFYGAAFVLASLVFALRTRWIVTIGASTVVAAAALHWWVAARAADGKPVDWLIRPATLTTESPRGLLFDTFVNGTHPMLPWFAFMCLGIVVGRTLRTVRPLVWAAGGAVATALAYLANHVATAGHAGDPVYVTVLSTRPFDRGLLYSICTTGTALVAFGVISWLSERHRNSEPVLLLARAGQMTLTIYVAHVLVFRLVVDWLGLVGGNGLDAALVFAGLFWIVAIGVASWWRRLIGIGPLESLYRKFGG